MRTPRSSIVIDTPSLLRPSLLLSIRILASRGAFGGFGGAGGSGTSAFGGSLWIVSTSVVFHENGGIFSSTDAKISSRIDRNPNCHHVMLTSQPA